MSSAITRSQVKRQLAAMASDYFDIGILRPDGRMLLCEAYTFSQIEQAIQPLRRENARGAHIFVRPHGAHTLNLVDDLGVDAVARMTDAGFQPALVVETSPQNFQVWLNHRRTLDRNLSTWAAKELAKRFGGDLSSADWRHFGRLAGFTNQKPKRRLQTGLPPFVRLHECDGHTYAAAREFLEDVKSLAYKASAERSTRI
jgi:RepB DNA-primase from phage plasmid